MLIAAEPQNFAGFWRADANRATFGTKCRRIVNGLELTEDSQAECDSFLHGVKHWSLPTFREKLIKIGAKVVMHSRYVLLQMAEVAVPRALFRAIRERIRRLCCPHTGPAPPG